MRASDRGLLQEFLREGELRTHRVTGMEKGANTHSASPATKALDRPAREAPGEAGQLLLGKGSGLMQLPVFKEQDLEFPVSGSCTDASPDRKTGLGDGLGPGRF